MQKLLKLVAVAFIFTACDREPQTPSLNHQQLANHYFEEDARWYAENIPFFECSDKQIEEVYYYRWKLYKAHLRNVGPNEFIVTEFINHVPWDRDPFCTINAASMHHIYEGRWLKDSRYMDGYIRYLYQGGNNRRYSESIADAAWARYLVDGDAAFLTQQLDSMKSIYEQWYDHWDSAKNLYYIPAMPDATEYTIASIDASGGKDGFEGGEAFRPTINSYMYGNALAIGQIAAMQGDTATTRQYFDRAASLKKNVEDHLWNPALNHFTDRFKVDNAYVRYWDFIRGRELAGMIPWYFNLPSDDPKYAAAWKHVIDTTHLLGKFGFRTNEPAYEYYFKQFVFFEGKRGSQWNGPNWPYQSSQVLTAMANVLNDYHQDVVSTTDYLKLLRLYTRQHYLPDGKVNLVENYDPNLGGPIVHYYWSNHYLHSSYNNLIISGLVGIRPSASDTLVVNPLVDSSIKYFMLDDVSYHGHKLTVVYDADGTQYNLGKGVTVFVDGSKTKVIPDNGKHLVPIGEAIVKAVPEAPVNAALNIARKEYPVPSASVNTLPDSLYQAIDGRIWYFREITNQWTTEGSDAKTDWYALDFGTPRAISTVKVYFIADQNDLALPGEVRIEYYSEGAWQAVSGPSFRSFTSNTVNVLSFDSVTTSRLRIHFTRGSKPVGVSEIECY